MNKTFTAGENLVLVDGEIYLLTTNCKKGDLLIDYKFMEFYKAKEDSDCLIKHVFKVLASTKQLEGIKQLDRSRFVKPVDLEELAINIFKSSKEDMEDWKEGLMMGFKSGYNANKAEYTKEEAIALFNEGCRQGTGDYPLMTFDRCVEILRPLTLPKQIITDQEYNVIEVLW